MPSFSKSSRRTGKKRNYRMGRDLLELREQVRDLQELRGQVKDLQESLSSYENDIDELDGRVDDLNNRVMDELDDKDF